MQNRLKGVESYCMAVRILSGIGIGLACLAWLVSIDGDCKCLAARNQPGITSLLGVPIALIGIIGYGMIMKISKIIFHNPREASFNLATQYVLIACAFLFTFFLFFRSVAYGHWCPFCILSWAINILLFILAFRHFHKEGRDYIFS